MQITEIKKDKLHLMKVTFDNDSQILLDKTVCADKCLNVGMHLEQTQLKELKFLSDYTRAKSRAVWYFDRQDHTEKALYDKLVRAGFSKQASAKVIARFIEVGLIDDERYARNYAERLMEANVSKREAVQKLILKGVPYDLAKAALEETEADAQTQIKNLLDRKYCTKLTDQKGVEKVFAALARKGFSYGDIKESLKTYIEESEDEYV